MRIADDRQRRRVPGGYVTGSVQQSPEFIFYRDFQEVTGINEMLDGKSGRIAV